MSLVDELVLSTPIEHTDLPLHAIVTGMSYYLLFAHIQETNLMLTPFHSA
jgi:hypothetical protein